MATRANADWLRHHNFGARSLVGDVTIETVLAEVERYDAQDAATLTAYLRPMIDLEPQLDVFERLYAEVIEESAALAINESDFVKELGPFLHRWLPRYPGTEWPWQQERAALIDEVARLDATLRRERTEMIRLVQSSSERAGETRTETRTNSRDRTGHRRLEGPFHRELDAAWQISLSFDPLLMPLKPLTDDPDHAERSPLRLLEDGVPLGPAHSQHSDIRTQGRGRYSHWSGNRLLFSTSDNTDSNTNGREYAIAWMIFED